MKIPFFTQRRVALKRIFQYSTLGLFALSTSLLSIRFRPTQAQEKVGFSSQVINIGYQTTGEIAKAKKVLEPRFQALGVKVNWVGPFPGGIQLIEAMNAGKLDIGPTGEPGPIFSQAAGVTGVIYISGRVASKGLGQGVVVKSNSSIRKIEDIRGKKVAFPRGSSAHYLVGRALAEVGLRISDVQAVALTPSEGRDAFINDKVEVWVASDPLLALVEKNIPVRNLRNASRINTLGGFYVGRREFATKNPQLVRVFLEEVDKIGEWADKNPKEVAKAFAPELKIDESVLETVARRRTYRLRKITPAVIAEQQKIADFFFEEKIIPRKINVREITLTPELYKAITPHRLK